MDDPKVFEMEFSKVYPLLTAKAVRKGRTRQEVDEVLCWLTGYAPEDIRRAEETPTRYGEFFRAAPAPNPAREKITGSVCGVKLAEIADPLMREIRYFDKLVDELARGRPMERILRR